ncbi:MAG TPA: glycoside hydrolase family 9 protein, partial [Pseudoxanthomonas sp.]|nr:glycoside hydrolase family 9 protein [Pseudoxanthomonas sp.]
GYDDALADEALRTAQKVWDEEQSRPPYTFKFGNTTGGPLADEEFKAAVELLQATKQDKYARRVAALLPEVSTRFFGDNVAIAVRALPMMDAGYKAKLRELAQAYVVGLRKSQQENPFGVIVTRAGWAGNAAVVTQAIANDYLRRAFPDLLDRADVYRGLDYLFGTHPGGDHSFVSAVGAKSQLVAYGMNRADFSYIAGGVVPGVLVLPPDLPENRTNWPFFWGQNEYVVDLGGSYLYLANAVQELLAKE